MIWIFVALTCSGVAIGIPLGEAEFNWADRVGLPLGVIGVFITGVNVGIRLANR